MPEQEFTYLLIDSRYGPVAASPDFDTVSAAMVKAVGAGADCGTLVNPGAFRIKSVPGIKGDFTPIP